MTMARDEPNRLSRLQTADAAARYLGISMPTMYRLLRSRKLKGIRVGGQWRVSDEALREFLEEGVRVPINQKSGD
jgi:excisionase family DNA binding protein